MATRGCDQVKVDPPPYKKNTEKAAGRSSYEL